MTELIHDVLHWYTEGWAPVAAAVLTNMEGSAVRGLGAAMAIRKDGLITGSVSGGCIESSVINAAERVFSTGRTEVLTFCQIDDEILGSVSPCGGELSIMVCLMDKAFFLAFCTLAEKGRGGRWGIVTSGPQKAVGSMFAVDSNNRILSESFGGLTSVPEETVQSITDISSVKMETGTIKEGDYTFFSAVLAPVPQLIIIGASHIGLALQSIAEQIGYRVSIIDPRSSFTRKERFKKTDRVFTQWPRKAFKTIHPTPYTAVAALTHDPKIDDQALEIAVKTECFYIGALGSTATHRERIMRMKDKGVPETVCAKIHGPIGLRINAAKPEEIALSIMAEIVKEYRSRYGKKQ